MKKVIYVFDDIPDYHQHKSEEGYLYETDEDAEFNRKEYIAFNEGYGAFIDKMDREGAESITEGYGMDYIFATNRDQLIKDCLDYYCGDWDEYDDVGFIMDEDACKWYGWELVKVTRGMK